VTASAALRVLAITKIFPNALEPLSAPFNRQQFAALATRCHVEVMATIPWFPGAGALGRWSSAGKLANVPRRERIGEIEVSHPRTLFVPRLAHATWGPLYAASIAPSVLARRGDFDVVLGSWAYPDGFAAVIAAELLGVPAVVKLHGSDINAIAQLPGPRAMLRWALPRAARVVAVSRPLADAAIELGVEPERIAVVRNGVDGELFHVRDRAPARARLGLPAGPLALYVGNLKPEKGVLELAAAWTIVARARPDATLVLVGAGPLAAAIERELAPIGDRVRMVGAVPLAAVPDYLAAADLLVLPSHMEGTPNVVLEAHASGRRVVATRIGGVPDLVTDALLGELVPPRDPAALATALIAALATPYDPAQVAARSASSGWAASAAALHDVLASATVERR